MNLTAVFPNSFTDEKVRNLEYTNTIIEDKEFESCNFDHCRLIEVELKNCHFTDCKFTNSVISASKLTNSSFLGMVFENCKVIGIDWTLAKNVRHLEFMDCDISYSNFSFLKLPNTKMIQCSVKDVDFNTTDLSNSNLTGCDLFNTKFLQTNLTHADLRKACNYQINFQSNILKKTQFSMPEAANLLKTLDIILEE